MKYSTKRLIALFTATLISLPVWYAPFVTTVRASVSETYVYVCNDPWGNWPCGIGRFGPVNYENGYVAHVLANEWPGEAGGQALKAGAIAIRTFGWRDIPCGAIDNYYTVGSTQYRIENNYSQRYWLPSGSQNPILTKHTNAVNETTGVTLRNHTNNTYICAKYKADCGNPTADGSDEPWTLVGVPDPVDNDNGGYYLEGLSQNGSHAWELDGYAGAAPWDYRQILTHYYAQVSMSGLAFNRWTWLDADTAGGVRYTGYSGEQYYGPLARTPQTMQTGRAYQVSFHIQNTSPYQWHNDGDYAERLSYHWYDSVGGLVTWDGLRTPLGTSIVYPSRDIQLQAKVVAPFHPGTYTLKWDMVSGPYWFSTQSDGWPTQDIIVNVQPSAGLAHLPFVQNSGGWVSTISIHNNTGYSALADVTYISGGDTDSSFSYWVSPYGTINVTPQSGFIGSAWVAADRDITVSVSPEPEQVFLPLALKEYPPLCAPSRSISCGSTHDWNNGWSGSRDAVDFYSCSSWNESGPEYVYSFVPNVSGTANASLSNLSADLDVFILDGSGGGCHPDNCIAYGNYTATFAVVAGHPYYIVVDGYQGAVSNYRLTVSCSAD